MAFVSLLLNQVLNLVTGQGFYRSTETGNVNGL